MGGVGRRAPGAASPRRRARRGGRSAGRRSRPSRTAAATRASPRSASTSRRRRRAGASAWRCSSGWSRDSEAGGIWTLQAGIFPENLASVALHQRCGFRVVGRRERLGPAPRRVARRAPARTPERKCLAGVAVRAVSRGLSPGHGLRGHGRGSAQVPREGGTTHGTVHSGRVQGPVPGTRPEETGRGDQGRGGRAARAGRDRDRRGRGGDRPRRRHRRRGGRARPRARDHPRVPRPHLRVALPAEGAADVRRRRRARRRASWPRSPTPRAAATSRATASCGRRPSATPPTTGPARRLEEVESR